jgi:hypothetical protein
MFVHLDLQMIFNLICDFGTIHIQNHMISQTLENVQAVPYIVC